VPLNQAQYIDFTEEYSDGYTDAEDYDGGRKKYKFKKSKKSKTSKKTN